MRYSVWNGGGYSYYEAPGSLRDGVFAPTPSIRNRRPLGVAPEEAAPRLPLGAALVGKGLYPLGTIATRNGSAVLGALELDSSLVRALTYVAIGYAVYRLAGQK